MFIRILNSEMELATGCTEPGAVALTAAEAGQALRKAGVDKAEEITVNASVNIIKNASEAIGHDGEIYIRTSRNPVCLEIADTGKGIDKETEAKLFSPFFSTKRGGQGIGLIFIREVLQKHNCSFSLRTYADGLTRFRILFE